MKTNKYCMTLLALLVVTFYTFAQAQSKQIKALDKYIENAISVWNPPGLAVTVVKDGEIIFKKGYGVTTIGTENKVDENTLFGCMSTTKAFVSAGLAILVDEGKLNWDDKVTTHLPNFQLKDPYLTQEITVRDLLTHRTGLGNTDYLWSLMNISADSALYKMREVEKTYSLRSSFIYQNLMYLAAGQVLEAVSGQDWGTFLKERIYQPLGMNRTYATLGAIANESNKADAHYEIDGEITKIEQMSVDSAGPAGSMWSTIDDIGKWVQFLLNKGKVDGKQLISEVNFNELFKPQQIVPSSQFYPTQQLTKPHWMTYGLGWFQHDYRGEMVQFHTGSLAGMVAIIGMIPDENIGVYVMGNLDHVELRHAIMYTVFDLFKDGEITRDWSTDLYALYHPKDQPTPPTLAPIKDADFNLTASDIVGSYTNVTLGNLVISDNNGSLHFNLNNTLNGVLTPLHYNTYEVTFDRKYYGTAPAAFRRGTDGAIDYLEVLGERFNFNKTKD